LAKKLGAGFVESSAKDNLNVGMSIAPYPDHHHNHLPYNPVPSTLSCPTSSYTQRRPSLTSSPNAVPHLLFIGLSPSLHVTPTPLHTATLESRAQLNKQAKRSMSYVRRCRNGGTQRQRRRRPVGSPDGAARLLSGIY